MRVPRGSNRRMHCYMYEARTEEAAGLRRPMSHSAPHPGDTRQRWITVEVSMQCRASLANRVRCGLPADTGFPRVRDGAMWRPSQRCGGNRCIRFAALSRNGRVRIAEPRGGLEWPGDHATSDFPDRGSKVARCRLSPRPHEESVYSGFPWRKRALPFPFRPRWTSILHRMLKSLEAHPRRLRRFFA
jgi:hypothetical protein